jgi:hypothetical protein
MTIDSTIELELRVSLDRLQQMLQPVLHLRFADAGRTVAAPAGAAELAAKCNDVPSTRIPRDAASQSLPAPHPPLPLPLLDFTSSRPATDPATSARPALRRRAPHHILPRRTGLQRAIRPTHEIWAAGAKLPGCGGDPGAPRRGRILHARARRSKRKGSFVLSRRGREAEERRPRWRGASAAASGGSSSGRRRRHLAGRARAPSLPISPWARGALEKRGGAHGRRLLHSRRSSSSPQRGRLLPRRRLSSSSPSVCGSQRPGVDAAVVARRCWRHPSPPVPASSLSFPQPTMQRGDPLETVLGVWSAAPKTKV